MIETNRIIEYIKHSTENHKLEFKESKDFPKSFWETYSSFSNTEGGIIVLGVKESKNENIIVGLNNPDKVLTDLWNGLSNPNKVNFRTIQNSDIQTLECHNKKIIIVYVPEAPMLNKPIYINNKLDQTYIRTHDGDRLANKDEIKSFLRNASPNSDSLQLDGFTLDDLDTYSVLSFKEKVSYRYPQKKYIQMNNQEFLTEIGACHKDRRSGDIKLKRGALLFFGKYNSIKELYPHYHLDYFNRKGSSRWIDRISDDEPNEMEMNIYNFFCIVSDKLQNILTTTFSLDKSNERRSSFGFDSSIREALVNCLVHADYDQNYPSTKIEVFDGLFVFKNPGQLLISKKQFVIGGDSRPRNDVMMKFFRLLGFSERQGFGGPQIFKSASENAYRCPELDTNISFTELKIWNVDLISSYPELTNNEKNILRYIIKENIVTFNEIKNFTNLSEYFTRRSIESLISKSIVEKSGKGKSTKYHLNSNRPEIITQLQLMVDNVKKNI